MESSTKTNDSGREDGKHRLGGMLRNAVLTTAFLGAAAVAARAQTSGISVDGSSDFMSSAGPAISKVLTLKPRMDLPLSSGLTVSGWYSTSTAGANSTNTIKVGNLHELGVAVMGHGPIFSIGKAGSVVLELGVQNWNYNPEESFYHNIYVAGGSLGFAGPVDVKATLFRQMWGGDTDTLFNSIGGITSNLGTLSSKFFKNRNRALMVVASKGFALAGSDTESTGIIITPELIWGYSKIIGQYDADYRGAGISLLLKGGGISLDAYAKQIVQSNRGTFSELGVIVILGE